MRHFLIKEKLIVCSYFVSMPEKDFLDLIPVEKFRIEILICSNRFRLDDSRITENRQIML